MKKIRQTLATRIALFFVVFSSGTKLLAASLSSGKVKQQPSNVQTAVPGVRVSSGPVPAVAKTIPVVTSASMKSQDNTHHMDGSASGNNAMNNQNKPFCVYFATNCNIGGCGGGTTNFFTMPGPTTPCGGTTPTPPPNPQ